MQVNIPSIAETQITGFIGSAEKELRGHRYVISFYAGRTTLEKDGQPLATVPKAAAAFVRQAFNFFKSAQDLAA
jgi:hypothetical protein